MEKVDSADGTPIAYERTGAGPALVVVTGAFCDRRSSASLAAGLDGFTVVRYDRRGRGDSGDTAPYATEREVEDLAAVLTATGGPAYVFGHSSGAVLALEAAAAGVPMHRLAVYEPPYTGGGEPAEPFATRLAGLVAAGDRGRAAKEFLALTGMPDAALEHISSSPGWPAMEAIAHTLAYDVRLCDDGLVPAERLARIATPTLVLAGGNSAPWASTAATAVAGAVPDATARVVPDQDHGIADDALIPILTDFFR
ncbi:alpha/beta fold hydrolase [Actinocatenispora rupis]|uniref:Alpha/beta hydrolase n=1 Tax=Actinocatenispora rupis TaxID=519421 RepID=A0A8J3NGK5_9ACTN|nr:alpha/beta hydrolase [Actinocatenispora rupis]GID16055.1 alpha/beta hydrolase [Actinocatenispora rupis]